MARPRKYKESESLTIRAEKSIHRFLTDTCDISGSIQAFAGAAMTYQILPVMTEAEAMFCFDALNGHKLMALEGKELAEAMRCKFDDAEQYDSLSSKYWIEPEGLARFEEKYRSWIATEWQAIIYAAQATWALSTASNGAAFDLWQFFKK